VKISCPTCAAKYSVADEKIQSRLAKIRCRKCSATIVIDGMTTPASVYIGEPGAPLASGPPPRETAGDGVGGRPSGASFSSPAAAVSAPAAAPAEPVGPATDEYAVDIADNDQRNMTIHQIVGAYNEGLITADTYIWKEGMADWQTLAEVKAVADAIQAAARPVAPAAAVRRAEQGSGPDLFGRIATAGGEDDISTSAPEPTVSAGTGARNESSVLFSLSALTGSTESASTSSGGKGGRKTSEDSGLIDLTALTAAEANAGGLGASASAYGASPLISAPLGGVSGPALGAGLASGYGAPRSSGRTLIVAASVLAVAILGGAGLLVMNRGGGDVEPTSSLEPAPAAAPAEKRPAEPDPSAAKAEPTKETEPASVKDTVSADELPAAAPEPVAKPAPRPVAPKPKPAPAPVRAKPPAPAPEPVAAPPKPAPEAAPAPKKPAGPRCDCKPADLMCAMRCSAKK
jgi:predicted Zn finger-like uncharacterized protein